MSSKNSCMKQKMDFMQKNIFLYVGQFLFQIRHDTLEVIIQQGKKGGVAKKNR